MNWGPYSESKISSKCVEEPTLNLLEKKPEVIKICGREGDTYKRILDKYQTLCAGVYGIPCNAKDAYPINMPEEPYSVLEVTGPLSEKEKTLLSELSQLGEAKFVTAYDIMIKQIVPKLRDRCKKEDSSEELTGLMAAFGADMALYDEKYNFYPSGFDHYFDGESKRIAQAVLDSPESDSLFDLFKQNPIYPVVFEFIGKANDIEGKDTMFSQSLTVRDSLVTEMCTYLKKNPLEA
jgi:hypothetical protein